MFEKLACSLGSNSEIPNIELAVELCQTNNRDGIKEIVEGLKNKNKAIANDCVKVLYEVGERKPELVEEYMEDIILLLKSKNNRLVWGGMTALAAIADRKPLEIYSHIDFIKKAYESGSVITVDNSMTVFAKICKANKQYEKEIFPLLIKHLSTCRPKEIPQHAERISICIDHENAKEFITILEKRKGVLTPSQLKRLHKVINTINART